MSVPVYNAALRDAAHVVRRVIDDAGGADEQTMRLFVRALARIEELKKTPRTRSPNKPRAALTTG